MTFVALVGPAKLKAAWNRAKLHNGRCTSYGRKYRRMIVWGRLSLVALFSSLAYSCVPALWTDDMLPGTDQQFYCSKRFRERRNTIAQRKALCLRRSFVQFSACHALSFLVSPAAPVGHLWCADPYCGDCRGGPYACDVYRYADFLPVLPTVIHDGAAAQDGTSHRHKKQPCCLFASFSLSWLSAQWVPLFKFHCFSTGIGGLERSNASTIVANWIKQGGRGIDTAGCSATSKDCAEVFSRCQKCHVFPPRPLPIETNQLFRRTSADSPSHFAVWKCVKRWSGQLKNPDFFCVSCAAQESYPGAGKSRHRSQGCVHHHKATWFWRSLKSCEKLAETNLILAETSTCCEASRRNVWLPPVPSNYNSISGLAG